MGETTSVLTPEILSTHTYAMDLPRLISAIANVQDEFTLPDNDIDSLDKAMATLPQRVRIKDETYFEIINSILEVANSPDTHVSLSMFTPKNVVNQAQ